MHAQNTHTTPAGIFMTHEDGPMLIMERLERQGLDPQSTSTNAELGIGTIRTLGMGLIVSIGTLFHVDPQPSIVPRGPTPQSVLIAGEKLRKLSVSRKATTPFETVHTLTYKTRCLF